MALKSEIRLQKSGIRKSEIELGAKSESVHVVEDVLAVSWSGRTLLSDEPFRRYDAKTFGVLKPEMVLDPRLRDERAVRSGPKLVCGESKGST